MPVSNLDPAALARMTPQQIADLALQADQERRQAARESNFFAALAWQQESERLCEAFQKRQVT